MALTTSFGDTVDCEGPFPSNDTTLHDDVEVHPTTVVALAGARLGGWRDSQTKKKDHFSTSMSIRWLPLGSARRF